MENILGRLQDLLRPFRSSENGTGEKFFRDDAVALKILAAWPDLPLTIHEPFAFGTVPQHKANQWKFAWKFRKIDFRDLEKATGVEDRDLLQKKMEELIAHQMIYPDGSLSRAAQSLVSVR